MFALPALTLFIGKKERTVARAYCPFPFFTKTISNLEIHSHASQFLIPSMFALPVFTLSPAKTKKDCNNAVRFCFFHLLSVIYYTINKLVNYVYHQYLRFQFSQTATHSRRFQFLPAQNEVPWRRPF